MTSKPRNRTSNSDKPIEASTTRENVRVVVVVNHDQLKTGEIGEVELTDTVRRRLDKGYLRLAEDDDVMPGDLVRPLGETTAPPPVELTQPALLGVAPAGPAAVTDQAPEGGKDATGGQGNDQG